MSLPGLPLDLLIQIQSLLKPLDILSLHSTSTTVRERASCRAVWLDALRRVIDENNVFAPSFDLRAMSMEELRHAALRPQVLMQRLRRASPISSLLGEVSPRSRSQTTLGSPLPPSLRDCRAKGVTLVPGGRFLLVDSPEMFRVFDLGRGYSQSSQLQPSVSLIKRDLTHDPAHCISSLHIIRGDDIVVIFSLSLRHDTVYATPVGPVSLVAYKIRNLSSTPTGEVISRLTFEGPEQLRAISYNAVKNQVAFVGRGSTVFGMWDFELNVVALIRSLNDDKLYDDEAILSRNSLILRSSAAFFIYELPPFSPVSSSLSPLRLDPIFVVSDTHACGDAIFLQHRANGAQFIDLQHLDRHGHFCRYRLHPESPTDPQSLIIPVSDAGDAKFYPNEYDLSKDHCHIRPMRACDGGLVRMGHSSGWVDSSMEAHNRRKAEARAGPIDYSGLVDETLGDGSDEDEDDEEYPDDVDEIQSYIEMADDQAGVHIHVQHRDAQSRSASGRVAAANPTDLDLVVNVLDGQDPVWQSSFDLGNIDLCPVSARLCAVTGGKDGYLRLHVLDYLPPMAQ
ncbi:uncharacterized protein SCHCODRAFT_01169057 [Schizophyllum commune H4-8]|nr:uncharacterized protein SCHCODRAFT_01169057 [Schizophyllum commune H4-8]KAI5899112.1 hypothetical protein SCHCODRAFT_01169057 [Schizophyllum commune H4-8]